MADGSAGGVSGKGKHKFLCGVPHEVCGGSIAILSAGFKGKSMRAHNSPSEAFNCYGRYLASLGYEKLNSREYREPNGGPIHVLTKKSRFGARLRSGKSNRNMPCNGRSGVCISK